MRIASLQLLAYGPFRGLELDLSAPGLHVISGRNEAGKSTTLRAITGLLFGIERNTRDAHLHKPGDLRIGGVLVSESGERVHVVRRKSPTSTLLDPSGDPIDEAIVTRLVRSVTAETFRNAFGLDHETLRRGAEALLAGKGDLGETLFDASVGGGGEIQKLLAELTAEADAIYRPRGKALPLNDALRGYQDAQKRVRELQSLPDSFVTQEQALVDARAERERTTIRRRELASLRAHLDRARRTVPLVRRRDEIVKQRAALGDVGRHAATVGALHQRALGYERAGTVRRELTYEVAEHRARIAEAARRAGLSANENEVAVADMPRLEARTEARLHALVAKRGELERQVAALRATVERSRRESERLRSKVSEREPVPDDGMHADVAGALERARALGDAESRTELESGRVARRRKELEAKVAALGLFEGTLEELAALRVPKTESLERLSARATELERMRARADGRHADLDQEAAALARQVAERRGDFAPPEASDLREARRARDDVWARARREPDAAVRSELEDELVRKIGEADAIADTMIREADRVTSLASIRSRLAALESERSKIEAEQKRLAADRTAVDAELGALFADAGMTPRGLGEMAAWLTRREQIVVAFEQLRESEGDVEDARRGIEKARDGLARALPRTAPNARTSLAELVASAERELAAIDARRRELAETQRRREELEVALDADAVALEKAETDLADVRRKLQAALEPLGIGEDAAPEEIMGVLEALRDLFVVTDKLMATEARMSAVTSEIEGFERDLAHVASAAAPDLDSLSPLDAIKTLVERCRAESTLEIELRTIEEKLRELAVPAETEVPEAVTTLGSDVTRLEEALEATDDDLAELDKQTERLTYDIGSMEGGLETLRGESHAADAASEAEEALSRVRAHVTRYCRAKLAAVLLSREIERYRDENQGPLLKSASALFARLTLGAFSSVRAGFDEKERPALRCVRAGGSELDVTALSEGTRDQLYLALRLASLGRYAEIAEPMPLVLDDVLIHFDDERSAAALAVLAELAQRAQVLFFTHHTRLVELARKVVPVEALHVHEIGRPQSADATPLTTFDRALR